jgi:arylsulfatase A-like enzyme
LATIAAQAQVAPNIIVMLADDMGIADTSAYLNRSLGPGAAPIKRTLRTPQLERLAAQGVLFTDVHSSSSMCSPSRYALLTGRYPWRTYNKHDVVEGWSARPLIDEGRPTLASLLKREGYRTAAIGKWHLGFRLIGQDGQSVPHETTEANWNRVRVGPAAGGGTVRSILDGPLDHGFDEFFGVDLNSGARNAGKLKGFIENDRFEGVPTWGGARTRSGGSTIGPGVPEWDLQRMGERYLNRILDRIDAHVAAGQDAPFFLYFSPQGNHVPVDPAESIVVQGQRHAIRDRARYTDGTDADLRGDMVLENDLAVGLLLDKLATLQDPRTGRPLRESTLFVFTSDNGSDVATSGVEGLSGKKLSLYEGGHRVPFIVVWPGGGVPAAAVSRAHFGQLDLYASIAALLGHPLGPDEAEDSADVLPALLGQVTDASFRRPHPLVMHDDSDPTNRLPDDALLAIREHPYVLLIDGQLVNQDRLAGSDRGRAVPLGLFNLDTDLGQKNNLLGLAQHRPLVDRLAGQLRDFHNRGSSRALGLGADQILHTDGGADLRNDRNGAVGYEFTVGAQPVLVRSLGLWDDAAADQANQETLRLDDGQTAGLPDGLKVRHRVRLFERSTRKLLATVAVTNANSYLQGEFRYVDLPAPVRLEAGATYALTMSTTAGDGDLFHHFAAFTGVSPAPSNLVGNFVARIATSAGGYPARHPDGPDGAANRHPDMFRARMFVGPNARIAPAAP